LWSAGSDMVPQHFVHPWMNVYLLVVFNVQF
jgi:hypothetical protein